jgi:hypothetical protein
MRGKGINYDSGVMPGNHTREFRSAPGHRPGASYGPVSLLPEGPGSGYQGLGWRPRLALETMAALQVS